jgi:folate-binding protein YgfZ
MNKDWMKGYHAANEHAGYHVLTDCGILLVSGMDRVDFLQRQTTNDVRLLNRGTVLPTVLTSPTARIIDVFLVFEGDLLSDNPAEVREKTFLISLPERHQETTRFLKSRIFIMDRVDVDDLSEQYALVNLFGPGSGSVLEGLGVLPLDKPSRISAAGFNGDVILIMRMHGMLYRGWGVVIPASRLSSFQVGLEALGVSRIRREGYRIIQVEQGLPSAEHELTEDFTPLEIGLHKAISDRKGCYTGQEVIARQLTYDKVTHRLVGLRLEGMLPRGTMLYADGKPAGEITSSVESPRFGHIALAVVKRPHYDEGSTLEFYESGKNETQIRKSATVISLPF